MSNRWFKSGNTGRWILKQSYPLVQASLTVKGRAGGHSGLKDKIPFTVHTTAIQVATVLASGVHLEGERHTAVVYLNVHISDVDKL